MVDAGPRGALGAAEEGLALGGRPPPVEVAHLDLGDLDAVVFILLVIHLEGVGWYLLAETLDDAQVRKGESEGTVGSLGLRVSRKVQGRQYRCIGRRFSDC